MIYIVVTIMLVPIGFHEPDIMSAALPPEFMKLVQHEGLEEEFPKLTRPRDTALQRLLATTSCPPTSYGWYKTSICLLHQIKELLAKAR